MTRQLVQGASEVAAKAGGMAIVDTKPLKFNADAKLNHTIDRNFKECNRAGAVNG
jgi:hypothetical protein